jgi:hypothetical protein
LPNKKHGLLPFASEDDSIYMKYWRTGGGGWEYSTVGQCLFICIKTVTFSCPFMTWSLQELAWREGITEGKCVYFRVIWRISW